MKAIWNDKVIAQADKKDLIYIEGNWYFPPESIENSFYKTNDQHTTCFWKGEANYYDVEVEGTTNQGGAWYYPNPMQDAISKVGKDFTNYVAFWRGIEVSE